MSTASKRRYRQRRKIDRAAMMLCAGDNLPEMLYADSETTVDFEAAAGDTDSSGPKKFSMVVYNGGLMNPAGFGFPAYVELAGMQLLKGSRPVLYIHDQERPVGHTTKIKLDSQLTAEGLISVDGPDAQRIINSHAAGFPWKSSMGIRMHHVKFYDDGATFTANGKRQKGPAYHVLKSTLHEISFVTLAGDDTSSASIAAQLGGSTWENGSMNFEQWLKAKGFDPATLSDDQKSFLKAMFDQEQSPGETGDQHAQPGAAANASAGATAALNATAGGAGGSTTAVVDVNAHLAELRAASAAELMRQGEIGRLCAQYGNPQIRVGADGNPVAAGGSLVNLQAHAVAQGWDANRTELQALRASRSEAPAIHIRTGNLDRNVLEAACCLTLNPAAEQTWLAQYGEQTLTAASQFRNIGLRELTAMACRMEGIHVPAVWGDGRETLRAAFTTTSLPYLFENVMNKTLLPIFEAMQRIATKIARVARTSDFKQVSRVRLLGSGAWEKVGADGQLKQGRISDEKFTNQVETFGQYLALTRTDWINDDLGALESIARYMAIMGGQVVEDEFFRTLLDNLTGGGALFSSGNGNLGAGVHFGAAGLSALKTIFRKIKAGPGTKNANKYPINVQASKLLVTVEYEDEADSLIGSSNLMMERMGTDGVPSKTAPKNPHAGRYEVLSAPQLSDPTFHANASEDHYFLFSDSMIVAAFEIAFLNGVQRPTIERVEAPPNYLGMGFRGYLDFGVAPQDPRGGAYDEGAPAES